MKRGFLLATAAMITFSATGKEYDRLIDIRTDNVSLVMGVNSAGHLKTLHFGGAIKDISAFGDFRRHTNDNYGTPYEAYPAMGERSYCEPALSITHSNGDLNTELTYVSHETGNLSGGVKEIVIHLEDKAEGTEVDVVYTAYPEQDVITCHTVIRNEGKGDMTLHNFYSSAMPVKARKYLLTHLHGTWGKESQVEHDLLTHGAKSIESRQGIRVTHAVNPAFMLSLDTDQFNEEYGNVIAGALAWSGNFKINFEILQEDVLNILAGINPYASEYRLGKGESFTTPEMIWTFSSEGAGGASRNLHRWARAWWIHSGASMAPALLNSWEGAHMKFTTKTLTDMIDDAADMGLEMFVLDDGWFGNKYPRDNDKAGLGDWDVNEKKLPEGIDHIASYAHSKGLKFGIWIEPEMVNPSSELYEKHPDWVVRDAVHEAPQARHQLLLDLSNPKVQDFVFGVFDNTMKLSKNIDYIKWDANRHVESVGSSYLPAEEQSKFWIRYIQGLYSVMERIRAKYPDVIIQSCSSGGGRAEYQALEYFDEYWTSDNTEALTRVKIQYGFGFFYPANAMASHVSVVPNRQTGNITPIKFRFDVACSGRLGMELQPKDMTDADKEFSGMAIGDYAKYKDIVMTGDIYRLGSPYDGSGTYALMYVTPDRRRAVLYTYCIEYQSRTVAPQFRLTGLSEDMDYKVTELNVKKPANWFSGKVLSGSLLVNKGVNPNIHKIYESAVFLLEAQ